MRPLDAEFIRTASRQAARGGAREVRARQGEARGGICGQPRGVEALPQNVGSACLRSSYKVLRHVGRLQKHESSPPAVQVVKHESSPPAVQVVLSGRTWANFEEFD